MGGNKRASQKRHSHSSGSVSVIEYLMGAWFGEACLFDRRATNTSTISTVAESELAMLNSREYRRVVRKYPKMLARHVQVDNAWKQGDIQLEQLSYGDKGDDTMSSGQLVE